MSEDVTTWFEFHPALTDEKKAEHAEVRAAHRELAAWIQEIIPPSRERSLAITAVQQSSLWCTAAVAYRIQPAPM